MEKNFFFLRHAKTPENYTHQELGVKFVGRTVDADIILPDESLIELIRQQAHGIKRAYSSPSKRCTKTVALINDICPQKDKRLLEIDYGLIDGLFLKEAQEQYPLLFEAWARGEDPKFPNGENSQDVLERILEFILDKKEMPGIDLVCTHNVVLRTLVGYSFKIPMKDWYKISVPHFELIPFKIMEREPVYTGSENQRQRLLKNVLDE